MTEVDDGYNWPRYRAHKVVRAAQIVGIDNTRLRPRLYVKADESGSVELFTPSVADMAEKAEVGNFAVIYDDGFRSISPAKAFTEGYRRIDGFDDAKLAAIAQVCHEVNRGLCEAAGDMSQKPWDQAEAWQRDSAIAGVRFAATHPDATPETQHEAWMADKIAAGWIWGAKKDPAAKTHPCIAPYHELPFEQRVKDHAFRAVVKAMMA